MKLTMWSMLRRSIAHRRARSLSALVALTVSAGVATALLTLYADLDAKLHHEFRNFGANVVVTGATGASLPLDSVARVQAAEEELAQTKARFLASRAQLNNFEQRVAAAEMRAVDAENAVQQIEDAIRTLLIGLTKDLIQKSSRRRESP